jgi:hypothetical protein
MNLSFHKHIRTVMSKLISLDRKLHVFMWILDLSEGQGKYLEELEKERRRSTVRVERIRKLHIKAYDIDLYERVREQDLKFSL